MATLLRSLRRLPGRPFPPGRVAILRLHGPIVGGGRSADRIELVRQLRESPRVPAVVLDVDSGGGSAPAADALHLALRSLAARKPLVAAITGVGASGAYLAAVAAQRVVAAPNAVVGSIGVIAAAPRFPALLDRLGIEVTEARAGHLKGMGAPWRPATPEERAKEQALVDAFYAAFVARVAEGRRMSEERVRQLATGEVWLGWQARDLGLVDEVGDLDRAVAIAAELAGIPPRATPVRLRRPLVSRLVDRFVARLAASLVDEVILRLGDRWR